MWDVTTDRVAPQYDAPIRNGDEAAPELHHIVNTLRNLNHTVEGECFWDGDDADDFGILFIKHNVLYVKQGMRVYTDAAPYQED